MAEQEKIEMKKCFLVIFALISMLGCSKIEDISKRPEYSGMIKKEFITKEEFAVFQFSDKKSGYYLDRFGTQDIPAKSSMGSFPFNYYGNTILGVLPKGSIFRITKITLKRGFESTHIWYYGEIVSDGQFKGYSVNVTFLEDYGTDKPKFDDKYAVEVSTK